jgi:carbonic anhydrase
MNKVRCAVIKGIALLALFSSVSLAEAATNLTASQALLSLFSGNNPFVLGNFAALSKNAQPGVRTTLAAGQSPYAIVLGCSDSRVPPELVFDKGLGEVFSVRVAGNVIALHEIGSIEYAIEHLCAPLIVVMGHSSCGAVSTAVDVYLGTINIGSLSSGIQSLVNDILPAVTTAATTVPALPADTYRARLISASIDQNAINSAINLKTQSLIVSDAIDPAIGMPPSCTLQAGKPARLVAGRYDLATGRVVLIPLP